MYLSLCPSIQPSFIHYPSIHPSIHLSCPFTRPASHTSVQPGSQPSKRYLLSADDVPGPAEHSLPWRGTGQVMSRRGLRLALLRWGPAQDGHRLVPGVPPSPGLPDLVRREAALASLLGKLSLTICSWERHLPRQRARKSTQTTDGFVLPRTRASHPPLPRTPPFTAF